MLIFDSAEEQFFYSWVKELMDKGIVLSCTNDIEPFLLFNSINISINRKKVNLLREKTYKPDFLLEINPEFKYFIDLENPELICNTPLFSNSINNQISLFHKNNFCHVEIKAQSKFKKFNNSDIEYNIIKKIVYDKYGIFINTIRPFHKEGLFAKTFTPLEYYNRFYKKDNNKRLKLQWEYKSLNDFLNHCK